MPHVEWFSLWGVNDDVLVICVLWGLLDWWGGGADDGGTTIIRKLL